MGRDKEEEKSGFREGAEQDGVYVKLAVCVYIWML